MVILFGNSPSQVILPAVVLKSLLFELVYVTFIFVGLAGVAATCHMCHFKQPISVQFCSLCLASFRAGWYSRSAVDLYFGDSGLNFGQGTGHPGFP